MKIKLTEKDVLTSALIAAYERELIEYRDELTLTKRPFATVQLFTTAAAAFIVACIRSAISHPLVLFVIFPTIAIWAILEQFEGSYTPYIDKLEFGVEFFVWWVGLGILSSIGLGSGLQSGVLFVFPHIIEVCLAAQACNTVDFEANTNMWFRNPPNLFQCPEISGNSTPTTYFGTWSKILPVCFFQAAGTAIGEIPPYWMTRSARLACIQSGLDAGNETLDEIECATPFGSNANTPMSAKSPRTRERLASSKYSYQRIVRKLKIFMVRFLRRHGFYGVLLMASFPNIAFDICGVFCGHYLMPFWTFFIATFVGKAIIRNGIQSMIFVALCSEQYMELLIVTLQQLAPDSLNIDETIRKVLEDSRASFHRGHKVEAAAALGNVTAVYGEAVMTTSGAGPGIPGASEAAGVSIEPIVSGKSETSLASTLMYYWQIVMTFVLLSFLTSCISQFAQHYKMTLDNDEVSRLRAKLMKQQMHGGDVPDDRDPTVATPYVRTQIPFIKAPNSSAVQSMNLINPNVESPASPWSLMLPEGDLHHHHASPEVLRPMDVSFCTSSDTPERKRD